MDAAQVTLLRPIKDANGVEIRDVTAKRVNWKTIRDTKHLTGEDKLDAWLRLLCDPPLVPSLSAQLDALDVILLQRCFDSFQTPVSASTTGAAG